MSELADTVLASLINQQIAVKYAYQSSEDDSGVTRGILMKYDSQYLLVRVFRHYKFGRYIPDIEWMDCLIFRHAVSNIHPVEWSRGEPE